MNASTKKKIEDRRPNNLPTSASFRAHFVSSFVCFVITGSLVTYAATCPLRHPVRSFRHQQVSGEIVAQGENGRQ
jgi:hypothetical protein